MGLLVQRKTLFESIIKEDDADDIMNGSVDGGQDALSPNQGGDNNQQEAPADNNNDQQKDNDDVNIDASLDGLDDATDDLAGGDDAGGDTGSDSGPDTSSSPSGEQQPEEEVNDDNTDIFSSLTAEEQAIKIKEQKKAFAQLYVSCDDAYTKITNIDNDIIDKQILERITNSIMKLKEYIKDYVLNQYPIKSYIENDIFFNRFCANFDAISSIIETLYTNKEDKT